MIHNRQIILDACLQGNVLTHLCSGEDYWSDFYTFSHINPADDQMKNMNSAKYRQNRRRIFCSLLVHFRTARHKWVNIHIYFLEFHFLGTVQKVQQFSEKETVGPSNKANLIFPTIMTACQSALKAVA